jgi:uncharacterized protein
MTQSGPITIYTTRTVRAGCEAAFEKALHEFVQRSLELPGQHGVHILRPPAGSSSREYGIVRKFADDDAISSFFHSPDFKDWSRAVGDLTEGDPRSEKLSGLETWFTPRGEPLRALPKWKMALATLAGVFPTAMFLGWTLGPAIGGLHPMVRALVFNAAMVVLLTWAVMPVVTRVLHRWLHAR